MSLLKALTVGGPLGLCHALREAFLNRRLAQINAHMLREREVHQEHMRLLRRQFDQVIDARQAANVRAAQFWKGLQ
jgi:hypothetical protein